MDYDETPTKGITMSQSVYSFLGSKLHLFLEDWIAEGYNKFTDAFIEAQIKHEKTHGRKWDPNEPILINYEEKDKEGFDRVGRIINLLAEINGDGIDIPEEQITSDHLIKL